MSASLVGSEMCIRDSPSCPSANRARLRRPGGRPQLVSGRGPDASGGGTPSAVSTGRAAESARRDG
eukprot:8747579-Alexandrium_andersonii.AAC.1